MTGIYFRIKRNGKWENKEIEYLTNKERYEMLQGWSKEQLLRTINHLCHGLYLLTDEEDELYEQII